jgi:hypothetical protein
MERKLFPEKAVVAGKFRITATHPHATFCGYVHEAIEEETARPLKLIALHSHFMIFTATPAVPDDLFVPFRTGEQGGLRYLTFYSEEEISYHEEMLRISGNERASDSFFLSLCRWLHRVWQTSKEAELLVPYLNPDLLFLSGKRIRALAPLPFDLAKMEAAVLEWQRFFSPVYLIHKKTSAKLSPVHYYFPIFVMLAEVVQKRPLERNALTHQIDIGHLRAGKYTPLLQRLFDVTNMEYETEEAVFASCQEFFLHELAVPLDITVAPAHIKGMCRVGNREVSFPGVYPLPHDTQNLSVVLPARVDDAPESGRYYEFVSLHATSVLHPIGHEPRAVVTDLQEITAPASLQLRAQYRAMTTFYLDIAVSGSKTRAAVCKGIEINQAPLSGNTCGVASDAPVYVRVMPQTGYTVAAWDIDGKRQAELAGRTACTLPATLHERRVRIELRREWSFLLLMLLVIFMLLAGGAALLFFLLQVPDG